MTQSENMAQLEQLQALKATRDRVLEVKERMVPLVEQMAAEGDPPSQIPNQRAQEGRGSHDVGEHGRPQFH